jgi:hypothetical protein
MCGNVVHVDLAHAPIRLIIAAPLHTRMKWTCGIVEDTQTLRRGKRFWADRSEQHRAWFAEKIRDVRRARIVGHNRAGIRNQVDEFFRRQSIHATTRVWLLDNTVELLQFFQQNFPSKSDNREVRLRKCFD